MLLSSREKKKYTHKTEHTVNWFLLYIYSVTPHLRWEGKEEGGRCRPSRFCGLAGREKQETQTYNKKKPKTNKQKQTASHHFYHLSSIVRLCFLFILCPPTRLVKVQDLRFFRLVYKQGKNNVDLLVILSIQQKLKRSFGSKVWKVRWPQQMGCERGLPR